MEENKKQNQYLIDEAAKQWVGILLANIKYKKLNTQTGNKLPAKVKKKTTIMKNNKPTMTREFMISEITDEDIEHAAASGGEETLGDRLREVLYMGFKGYNNMTDEEILKEYNQLKDDKKRWLAYVKMIGRQGGYSNRQTEKDRQHAIDLLVMDKIWDISYARNTDTLEWILAFGHTGYENMTNKQLQELLDAFDAEHLQELEKMLKEETKKHEEEGGGYL